MSWEVGNGTVDEAVRGQDAAPWLDTALVRWESDRRRGNQVPTRDDDDDTQQPGTPAGKPRRHPRAVQVMPDTERNLMLGITRFLRQCRDSAKMTNEQIAVAARRRLPLIAVGTVTHLLLPKHMSQQSDVGYRLLSAVLEAMGSSHAELESYLRLEDGGNGQAKQRFAQTQELERVLLQNFRRLSPMHKGWLIRHAQEYAGLDGIGMIADALAEGEDDGTPEA